MLTLKINNLPANLTTACPYIVYRLVRGEAWFYEAFSTESAARLCAEYVEGGIAFLGE
jgi:hypothetical protein